MYLGGPDDDGVHYHYANFTGSSYSNNRGRSITSAGDVNGDGFTDIIYGAQNHDTGGSEAGRAYVHYGGPSGGIGSSAKANVHPTDEVDADFGRAVTQVGDINGDGYHDIAVGAPGADAGGTDRGKVFIYLGEPGGIEASPSTTLSGTINNEAFGQSVTGGWDVNGDGYGDLVVGAPGYTGAHVGEGAAFLYLGGADGLSSSPAWNKTGGQAGAAFGSTVAMGDITRCARRPGRLRAAVRRRRDRRGPSAGLAWHGLGFGSAAAWSMEPDQGWPLHRTRPRG